MLKDGLTYLCFATADKKTAVCFSFLDEIRLKFCGSFEQDLVAKAMAYSTSFLDFKRILKEEMQRWSQVEHSDQKARFFFSCAFSLSADVLFQDCGCERQTRHGQDDDEEQH